MYLIELLSPPVRRGLGEAWQALPVVRSVNYKRRNIMLENKLNLSWAKSALVIGVACVSMNVSAHNPPTWSDSAGDVVNDGAGDCLHTVHWSQGGTCGEEPVVAVKKTAPAPEPAPAPAPKIVPFSLSSSAAFALSGSNLSSEGEAEVKRFADKLEGHDVKSITVEGYTDNTGPASFNQALSEKRANAVKDEMIKNGIDASLITAIGHGINDPIADNSTREGRAANRRVKVTVDGNN